MFDNYLKHMKLLNCVTSKAIGCYLAKLMNTLTGIILAIQLHLSIIKSMICQNYKLDILSISCDYGSNSRSPGVIYLKKHKFIL